MNTRLAGFCVVALSVAGFSACGSDSPPNRNAVTAALVKSAKDSGVNVDATCVSGVVAKFSDADFKIIQDSANDSDFDTSKLSADGQTKLVDLYNCTGGESGGSVPAAGDLNTTQQAVLSALETQFESSGLTVDKSCLEAIIAKVDTATIAQQNPEMLQQIGVDAVACVSKP